MPLTKGEEDELVNLRNRLMRVGMTEFSKKSWPRYVQLLRKRRASRDK